MATTSATTCFLPCTEHPQSFRRNLDKYAADEPLVFEGIHFLHVFLLTRHFVELHPYPRTEAQVTAVRRACTQRLPRPVPRQAQWPQLSCSAVFSMLTHGFTAEPG